MPTETKENKTSPARIPPQAIVPLAKGVVGGVAGGISAGAGELQQIKDEFKEKILDHKNLVKNYQCLLELV